MILQRNERILVVTKILIIFFATFVSFFILKSIFANVGGMPESFKKVYPESIFVKLGIINPILFLVFTIILLHLLINYIKIYTKIPFKSEIRGSIFGGMFGILWFLGFLELSIVYNSNITRHLLSAFRDMLSLLIFGTISGLLFKTKRNTNKYSWNIINLLAILFVGIFFLIMHILQYSLTLLKLNQTVSNWLQIFYLFSLGSWIGFMYTLLRQPDKKPIWNIIFFHVIYSVLIGSFIHHSIWCF